MSRKNLQVVIFDGSLMTDPSIHTTSKGTPVTTLIVANHDLHQNGPGQAIETLPRFKVTAWGNLAAPCAEFLRKGSHVLVTGRMTGCQAVGPQQGGPPIWTAPDGAARADYEINASLVQFLDPCPRKNLELPVRIPEWSRTQEQTLEGGTS